MAVTMGYDSLGRLGTTSNLIGTFTWTYEGGVTPRPQTLVYEQNGQMVLTTNYSYGGNNDDHRLQSVENVNNLGVNLSRHDYAYDGEGQITSWSKRLGASNATSDFWFDYDKAGQLVSSHDMVDVNESTYALDFGYDPAGNRTRDWTHDPRTRSQDGVVHEYTVNSLNQLEGLTTTVNSLPSTHSSVSYDGNGNMTADAFGRTYEWDAANRLVAINYPGSGNRSEFAYDGLNRRVRITEKGPGVTAEVQPISTSYSAFSTSPFLLAPGTYTLTFAGLDPAGGDHTAFVDDVRMNDSLVTNGSFESPHTSNFVYRPPDPPWSFQGNSGLVHNGSIDFQNAPAPDGVQAAFVQTVGTISQTFNTGGGTFTLAFKVAQRPGNTQKLRVTLQPYPPETVVKTFLWCGNKICEERDNTGANVIARFFAEGEQRLEGDVGNYYYTRDHLGSIREVIDSGGSLRAQYDYDAWGNSVVLDGAMNVDFGYTGHYFHAPSGLNLTLYRAYSPTMGRWLNRDPIGEDGGLNLYGYVLNTPVNAFDPLGTDTYFHDAQDTVAGLITGFVPFLPYDASNDAMRYGSYVGTATGLMFGAKGLVSGFKALVPGLTRCAAKSVTQLEFGFVNNLENPNFVLYKSSQFTPSMLRPGEHTLNLPYLRNEALDWAQNQQALQRAMNIGTPIREANPNALGGWLQREREFMRSGGWQRTQQGSDVFWVNPSGQ